MPSFGYRLELCDTLLTNITWKKKVRVRGADGLFRDRGKSMNSLRCLECGWVKPIILGEKTSVSPPVSKGGGTSEKTNLGKTTGDFVNISGLGSAGGSGCVQILNPP